MKKYLPLLVCLLIFSCAKQRLRKHACEDAAVFEKFNGGYFFMPNAFTPSADGNNDYLGVKYEGISHYWLVVRDHLGRVLYDSKKYDPWDGMSLVNPGKMAPSDNYKYHLDFTTNDGQAFCKTGKVSLVNNYELYQNGFLKKYCLDNLGECVFGTQWQGDTLPFKPQSESGEFWGAQCE